MGFGDFTNGFEGGLASFLGNLIWSAFVPVIIFGCPEESRAIAVIMVVAISAGWAYKDAVCMISAPVGTVIGHLCAASLIASYDPGSAFLVALPAIVSVAVSIVKLAASRNR